MTVTGKLKKILKTVCKEVERDVYTGDKDTYITYNVATENASGYADDRPSVETIYLQIHLFTPSDVDYSVIQDSIKSAVFDGGFSYPYVSLDAVETDTNKRHICLETNIEKEM